MGWHAFKQYLRYKRKAKTRHGVHSPFVFHFVEAALNKNKKLPLQKRIEHYFGKDKLIYINAPAAQLQQGFEKLLPILQADKVLVIPNIHATKKSSQTWELIANSGKVKLSIDLYKMGLLLFRDDFKEKQHFILRA